MDVQALLVPVASLMGDSVPWVEKTQEAAETEGKHELRFDVLDLRALFPFLIFTVLSDAPHQGSTGSLAVVPGQRWVDCDWKQARDEGRGVPCHMEGASPYNTFPLTSQASVVNQASGLPPHSTT